MNNWTIVLKRNDLDNLAATLIDAHKIEFSVLYNISDVYKTALKSIQPQLNLNLGNKKHSHSISIYICISYGD